MSPWKAGLQEHAARVGQRQARRREPGGQTLERLELFEIAAPAGFVRARQVAHQQGQRRMVEKGGLGGERIDIARWQAQAGHAGVDLQGGRQGAALRDGQVAPAPCLLQAVEHRDDARRRAGGLGPRLQAVEHIEAGLIAQNGPDGQRLAQVGDEEVPATRRFERGGDPGRAQAIGVGLDHRRRGGRRATPGQVTIIGDQSR
jgi:hypothetical protein